MAHLGKLETQLELPLPQPQPPHFSMAHMFLIQSEYGNGLIFRPLSAVYRGCVEGERRWGLAVGDMETRGEGGEKSAASLSPIWSVS